MLQSVIRGNVYQDNRGSLKYNNAFNLSEIKRMYLIENADTNLKRGWQGHKIEQRWFSAVAGKFEIKLLEINNWEKPAIDLKPNCFELNADRLDVLHIPKGYVSCIQAIEENSKLLIMSDYILGEIDDDFKFDLNYFDCTKIEIK